MSSGGNQPTLEDALALVLASLSLLGLGIFGPGIATGLTAGAPQLGAGAAVGTAQAIGGEAIAAAVGARSSRLVAFGNLILAAGLAIGLIWQAARGTVTPWVVQVDKLGQTQAVAPA